MTLPNLIATHSMHPHVLLQAKFFKTKFMLPGRIKNQVITHYVHFIRVSFSDFAGGQVEF
jgi:hypothetical protein